MTLDETPEVPAISPGNAGSDAAPAAPSLSLTDLHGMEVLGSVPIWVLSGLRLHRVGWRHLQSGWVVGVYEMDISAMDLDDEELSESDLLEE